MSSAGVGQLRPIDFGSDFNVMRFVVRQELARIATMMPVSVMAVHPGAGPPGSAGTVDVQPLVSMVDGDGNASPHGTIYGLPYFQPQGGTCAVILTPAVNDVGMAHFAMRDISAVVASGGAASTPASRRVLDMSDGVYVGGILNAAPTTMVQLAPSGITMTDSNGNSIATSASGITMADGNGNKVQMSAGSVNIVTPVFKVNGTPVTIP